MKIQPLGTHNYNPNLKGNEKLCKYAVTSLIAGSSLFMLSNAIDTLNISRNTKKSDIGLIDMTASVLAIFGTVTGLFGIAKNESSELDEEQNS